MKIVFAIDSFKGSLGSVEAGKAAAEGAMRAIPGAECAVRPLADGGEGTVEALAAGMGGELRRVEVSGPLDKPVVATYGIAGSTAIMEMAQASGITLVSAEERNPLLASTYGVGEMIADAIARGCRRFVVGIGGSATNDGGAGMLQALGFRLLDSSGAELPRGGGALANLAKIERGPESEKLAGCEFRIACDVSNPLCGPKGASAVFGPQKGLGENAIELMDGWLWNYSELVRKVFPETDKDFPGAGAAGGLGFAFKSFLNAELIPGMEKMMEITRLEEKIKAADIVVTGEGCLDSQSFMGKVPGAVAGAAKKYGKPVIAFAGMIKEEDMLLDKGIDAMFPIAGNPMSMEEAMKAENAKRNMEMTVEQVFRVVGIKDT